MKFTFFDFLLFFYSIFSIFANFSFNSFFWLHCSFFQFLIFIDCQIAFSVRISFLFDWLLESGRFSSHFGIEAHTRQPSISSLLKCELRSLLCADSFELFDVLCLTMFNQGRC